MLNHLLNKIISNYTLVILNDYLFSNIILSLNNIFNNNTNDFIIQFDTTNIYI
jgi:hypothetical protein